MNAPPLTLEEKQRPDVFADRRVRLAVLMPLILGGFWLRAHYLDYESFWLDEADSVRLASAPLSELIGRLTQVGENGPGYHLVLRFWMRLAGTSEYSVRYLSLLASVLTIPAFYALGKRLSGSNLGLAAVVLSVFSSYLAFYGQEAKMYSIVVLLCLLAGYLLVRAFDENRPSTWLGFLACTSLALYFHVFDALLIPSALVYGVFRLALDRRRGSFAVATASKTKQRNIDSRYDPEQVGAPNQPQAGDRQPLASVSANSAAGRIRSPWRAFLLVVAGLTIPYLPLALWQVRTLQLPRSPIESYYGTPGFDELVRLVIGRFATIHPNVPKEVEWLVFGGIALMGLLPFGRPDPTYAKRLLYIVAFFGVPCVLAALLFLRFPIFLERYLSLTLPPLFLAFAASGLVLRRLARPLVFVPAIILVSFNFLPLLDHHYFGILAKEAWRPATHFVEGRLEDGDVLLFLASDSWIAYDYYAQKPYVQFGGSEAAGHGPQWLDSAMKKYLAGRRRVWLIMSKYAQSDVDEVTGWLWNNATKVDEHNYRFVRTERWLPGLPSTQPPPPTHPVAIDFGGRFSLVGYDLGDAGSSPSAAAEPRCLPDEASCYLKMTLYYRAGDKADRDYRVSTKLVDANGTLWGQFDLAPSPFYPIENWRPGFVYREERYLTIVPGTPAGGYRVEVGAYDAETGDVLPARAQTGPSSAQVTIGEMMVGAPAGGWPEWSAAHGPRADFGKLRMVGSAIGPQKATVGTALDWTSSFSAATDLDGEAVVTLQSSAGAVASWRQQVALRPGLTTFQRKLQLPGQVQAGRYDVRLTIEQGGAPLRQTGLTALFNGDSVAIGTVEIQGRSIRFDAPVLAHPLAVRFHEGLTLLGYNLAQIVNGVEQPATGTVDRRATALVLSLIWKSGGPTTVPYTVFTHLADSDSQPRSQHDGPPGQVPSSTWIQNEVVTDRHVLPLSNVPGGQYRLLAGLYDPVSGKRLATETGGDFVSLGILIVSR